jgi:glyceraldehyde 3-phosphate dehydrogenase
MGLVIPELTGKLDGAAIRVPTANVSVVDLTFVTGRETTRDEINEAYVAAANGPLRNILAVTRDPLVSVDLNHTSVSSTVALPQNHVVDGRLARVLSWYDNEWGFSTRMADIAVEMGKLG